MEFKDRKSYQLPPPIHQSCPWLIFHHGRNSQRQTFFSISQDRYYIRVIPELYNKDILCYTKGCLMIKDRDSHDLFLLNFHAMETISLPKVDFNYDCCMLWLDPDDYYHVLFMSSNLLSSNCLMLYRIGDDEYVKKHIQLMEDEDIENGELEQVSRVSCHVVIKNKIYSILSLGDYFLVADIEESTIRYKRLTQKPLPLPSMFPRTCATGYYLIQSHDELLLVRMHVSHAFFEIIDIEVFIFDKSTNKWVETHDIGDKSIFTDHYEGICYDSTESKVKKNSIYFFESRDRCTYVFNMKDRSILKSLPCPIVSNRCSTPQWMYL